MLGPIFFFSICAVLFGWLGQVQESKIILCGLWSGAKLRKKFETGFRRVFFCCRRSIGGFGNLWAPDFHGNHCGGLGKGWASAPVLSGKDTSEDCPEAGLRSD